MALTSEIASTLLAVSTGAVTHGSGPAVAGDPTSEDAGQWPTGGDIDTEAAGTTLTGGAGAYGYGATVAAGFTQIVAQLHATTTGWLWAAMFDTPSILGIYFAEVGLGAAKSERVVQNLGIDIVSAAGGFVTIPFNGPVRVPGATRVSARVANAAAAADTIGIHVFGGWNME